MNIYLAGEREEKNGKKITTWEGIFILESYFYARNNKHFSRLIKTSSEILLDSGAFSFLNSNSATHWDEYLGKYADFINQYDIKLFFELDIDPIVGLQKVEQMRNKLEQLTGKKPIPVWHKNRGKQYFVDMCKEYDYVSLGGIVTREIPRKIYEGLFPWFIATAHANKTKIHALGYCSMEGLKKYKFDSVDSTTWVGGNLGGFIYHFNAYKGIIEQYKKPSGTKVKSAKTAMHNFKEWVRFSNYAKYHL